MKRILILAALATSVTLNAQTLEEKFRAFQTKAQSDYTDFRNQANQKYADFLRGSWEYLQQQPSIQQPEEKPVPPVVYEPQPKDAATDPQPHQVPVQVIAVPEPTPDPEPVAPIRQNEQPTTSRKLIYQGTEFNIRCPKTTLYLKAVDGDAIANAWMQLAQPNFDNMLFDCLKSKVSHRLCDWAYIGLVGQLAQQLYGASNEATLLQAFILSQSGYAMRLAQSSGKKLYMLLGSDYQLYDRSYYQIDGHYFYPISREVPNNLQICPGAYSNEQTFSLDIQPEQKLKVNEQAATARPLTADIIAQPVVNINAIQFYNDYPTGQIGGDCGTRWATYANAPMEECVRRSLYPTLMQAIQGLSEQQAVDKLLNWVQTAFKYEYDEKVWGGDRAFFPSETLHYPYADCEDRVILFSRVVRDLTRLDVALVYYPGHLAAAVAFNQDVQGDYLMANGKKYTICDPTYIGAPVGRTMPDMDNQQAKVIELKR